MSIVRDPADMIRIMARDAVIQHGEDRRTRKGTRMKSSLHPVDHVLVTLPPPLMAAAAKGILQVPRHIVVNHRRIPLKVSEKPAKRNRPTQRWMMHTMCKWIDPDHNREQGSVGRICLCPPDIE